MAGSTAPMLLFNRRGTNGKVEGIRQQPGSSLGGFVEVYALRWGLTPSSLRSSLVRPAYAARHRPAKRLFWFTSVTGFPWRCRI
jgi:hypothetical protein